MFKKALISALDMEQVRIGSSTSPAFQEINFIRLVADMFNLGVTLGLTLVSPNSFLPLSLRIWLTANFLSEDLELVRRERRTHSE